MSRLPIVLLHGYSAGERDVRPWREVLENAGYDPRTIHLGDYVSQSNEITIKDIAEGFDRALREEAGLSAEEPFDAIVHSTGSLVIREWLATYGSRRRRLKRLVGLAPANFGSPLAHRGQSWLSEVFTRGGELRADPEDDPAWDARLDVTPLLHDEKVKFFFPYTTTLVEIRLNREPMPASGPNKVLRFVPR